MKYFHFSLSSFLNSLLSSASQVKIGAVKEDVNLNWYFLEMGVRPSVDVLKNILRLDRALATWSEAAYALAVSQSVS